MMMGVWLATSFIGNFIAGWLGSFWSSMPKSGSFLMFAAIAGGAALIILAVARPLKDALGIEADV
jgi:POT family proton-dependent oligopeptide transporter